jgi:hypothetical protein
METNNKEKREWKSGWQWSALQSIKKKGFMLKWNNYTNFYLSDMYSLSGTCDFYAKELSRHILEDIAKQISCDLKKATEISSHKRKTAVAKYRIGKRTTYLIKRPVSTDALAKGTG